MTPTHACTHATAHSSASRDLGRLDDAALTTHVQAAVAMERSALLTVLLALAEIYRRGLHAREAFPSLFAYCLEHLGYARSGAFRRSHAARLIATIPIVGEYLLAGRITVTNLVALHRLLDLDNARALLDAISGKSEDNVRQLVASLVPALEPHGGTIAPAAPGRHLMTCYVSDDFVADFGQARELLSHSIPYGDIELVLHAALRALIKAKLRRRYGVTPGAVTS